jgi:DNA-binding transcriptional ArsR family regulator
MMNNKKAPQAGGPSGAVAETVDGSSIQQNAGDSKPIKSMADMDRHEFMIEAAKIKREGTIGRKEPTAIIKAFSEINPEPITWLWKNRIAMGKLTIYAGDPGLGKSQGTLDLAARVSLGKAFPDGSPCPLGDTIILSSEDDPSDTIRPRLDALEADVSRISIIKGERAPDGSTKPMSLLKVPTFMDAINQIREKGHDFHLLIVDPLDGFLAGGDSNSNEEVRAALDGLCSLAERERFSIVGIKHLNKAKGDAAYRVGGSIAFTAKARSVWIFTKDREKDRCLFLPQKNNMGPGGGGFQYSIQARDTGGIIAPFISWEGPADDDIQDVLNTQRPERERAAPEQDAILEVLQEAAPRHMTTGDIAAVLGKSKQAVSNALGKMKEKGKIVYPGYGQWTIPREVTPLTPDTPLTRPIGGDVTSGVTVTDGAYTPLDKSVSSVTGVTEPAPGQSAEPQFWEKGIAGYNRHSPRGPVPGGGMQGGAWPAHARAGRIP